MALIGKLSRGLKENGAFLLVEYNTDIANPWVPYPVSFDRLQAVFAKAGFTTVKKLGKGLHCINELICMQHILVDKFR
jgi:hypothetical protein